MYEYDLYKRNKRIDYLPRFYTHDNPSNIQISFNLQFIKTKNEELFKKIMNALDFIRRYFKDRIGRRLGRELKIPDVIQIITGKIPVKAMGGIAGVKILKPLAAVPADRKPIIFCDEDLKDLGDDELIFWILPHELLHLNGIDNEEFIERFLIKLNEDLGFTEISEKIRKKSGYLN